MFVEAVEGVAASVHLEDYAAEGPEVRGWQRDRLLEHLRADIKRRPHESIPSHLEVHCIPKSELNRVFNGCRVLIIKLEVVFLHLLLQVAGASNDLCVILLDELELVDFIVKVFGVAEIDLSTF